MATTGRNTVERAATVAGIGLHTGAAVTLTIRPAAPGHGIVFRRADLPRSPDIAVRLDAVHDTERRTVLAAGDARVQTVEHVLAAVAAWRLDDAVIELSGPEPPAGDGSAHPFFAALQRAGIRRQPGAPTHHTVAAERIVTEGDARYVIAPYDGCRISVTIDFQHPSIRRQSCSCEVTPERFGAELCRARTFGFVHDGPRLAARGLARGASAENTILLSATGVVGGPLRWPDEFVRHKAVDLLGDLALAGGRIRADIVAHRPSHRGNVAVARCLTASTGENGGAD